MEIARTQTRPALVADAVEMARLAGELGYPLSSAEMAQRLVGLLASERHYVAVAAGDQGLLAWMHVEHRSSLEGGDRAELMGLVVDSTARRRGLGRELVAVAERWALGRGLSSLTVRSNAARELSHPFYESLGYSRSKTQHVYGKVLSPNSAADGAPSATVNAHLRIARPVSDLGRSARMYRHGLSLEQLGSFKDHDGFDGVMLGHPDAAFHFEFTYCQHHAVAPISTAEDLLVFYVPDAESWDARCDAMQSAGFTEVESFNPYWSRAGRTFRDHDGYRVVIQRAAWRNGKS
jgi:GNAT superfamily N-acetyltransferase